MLFFAIVLQAFISLVFASVTCPVKVSHSKGSIDLQAKARSCTNLPKTVVPKNINVGKGGGLVIAYGKPNCDGPKLVLGKSPLKFDSNIPIKSIHVGCTWYKKQVFLFK